MSHPINSIDPVPPKERFIILDALRGLALLGICLANYPEFSLYTFQEAETVSSMPTSGIDTIIKYVQYLFIDGKFYSIFSLLFGIGFSIILSNASQRNGNGTRFFYRRMFLLFLIGLFHLVFLWAGDILILYAFMGFFLPAFRNTSNKKILIYATLLLLFPVVIDTFVVIFHWNLSAPVIKATRYFHQQYGITDANFPVWLAESKSYREILQFNIAGSFIRMQEFIEGNRAFKVLGLFLIGLYIGRNKLYANPENHKELIRKIQFYGFLLGLPTSVLYAYSAMNQYPFGIIIHSLLYALSVVPLSLAYVCFIVRYYLHHKEQSVFRILAAPGKMALTNYLMQSVLGILIFYGIGLGLGAETGLVYVELIAAFVFLFQIVYSYLWLRQNRFGPLEWAWRMLTYGKRLKLAK